MPGRTLFLHGDSARGPRNEHNEDEARRERAAARNRYGGDLRSFHFLMSPPKSDFESISGAVYGVSGANPPSAPMYFFGWSVRTSVCPVLVIALSQEPIDGLPPNLNHACILQSQ